jgi:hypothetical protein
MSSAPRSVLSSGRELGWVAVACIRKLEPFETSFVQIQPVGPKTSLLKSPFGEVPSSPISTEMTCSYSRGTLFGHFARHDSHFVTPHTPASACKPFVTDTRRSTSSLLTPNAKASH